MVLGRQVGWGNRPKIDQKRGKERPKAEKASAARQRAGVAREALSLDDGLENEAPEEFVDPLTAELMKSPVKLPSGNVVDDSTIRQHLLNELSDPFSRQPLEPADLEPLPDLKKRIEEWLAAKRAERRAARGG